MGVQCGTSIGFEYVDDVINEYVWLLLRVDVRYRTVDVTGHVFRRIIEMKHDCR
jgi:hypothetical protein